MKTSSIILSFCLFSMLSCATIKNSSGYLITNKSYEGSDGKINTVYKQTYCNNQKAVAWYKVNGFDYLNWVYFHIKNEKYIVEINNRQYNIDIDKIMPLDIGQSEALKIAQNAGFNTYAEFRSNFEEQQKMAQKERKRQEDLARVERRRQEEENRLALIRQREEIDNKFGVVAIGSLLHVKNGEVQPGEIIRLGDTFSYNFNNWKRLSSGAFVFGDFDEFEIRGLDMRQVNVKEVQSGNLRDTSFSSGRLTSNPTGRRGYIVKYLGIEDVITQAGLRKVIWVLECIGGNIYAE